MPRNSSADVEPARSLNHLQHPERWTAWSGTACPLKKPSKIAGPGGFPWAVATVFFWEGKYQIREEQMIFLPAAKEGWVDTTPEKIIEDGWRVD